jgi:hypothetical protein
MAPPFLASAPDGVVKKERKIMYYGNSDYYENFNFMLITN